MFYSSTDTRETAFAHFAADLLKSDRFPGQWKAASIAKSRPAIVALLTFLAQERQGSRTSMARKLVTVGYLPLQSALGVAIEGQLLWPAEVSRHENRPPCSELATPRSSAACGKAPVFGASLSKLLFKAKRGDCCSA